MELEDERNSPTARRFSVLASVLVMCIGILVMIGWIIQSSILVQIHPQFVPMQFNTALCFTLISLGQLLAHGGFKRTGYATVLVSSTLAGLTLSQTVLGVDLGFDTPLGEPFTSEKTPYAGRMGVNTSIAFMLFGAIALLKLFPSKLLDQWRVSDMLATLVLSLSAIALFGYFAGIEFAYAWRNLSGMALHTSSCFSLLSIALLVSSHRSDGVEFGRLLVIRPIQYGIAGVTLSFLLWQAVLSSQEAKLDQIAEHRLIQIENLVRIELSGTESVLRRALDHYSYTRDSAYSEKEFSELISNHPYLSRLKLVDLENAVDVEAANDSTQANPSEYELAILQRSYSAADSGISLEAQLRLDLFFRSMDVFLDDSFAVEVENENGIVYSYGEGVTVNGSRARVLLDDFPQPLYISIELTHEGESRLRSHISDLILYSSLGLSGMLVGFSRMSLLNKQNALLAKGHEERLLAAVASAPNGILVVDWKGCITMANAQIENLFGWTQRELIGQSVDILVPEAARMRHSSHRKSYESETHPRLMGNGRELQGQRKDGSQFSVEVGLSPFVTDEGRFVIASVVDVTERKRIESVAKRLALIVETSGDAIIGKDLSGKVESWNKGAERLYGHTENEMIGRSISRLFPAGKSKEMQWILDTLNRGESIDRFETEHLHSSGSRIHVSLTVSPMTRSDGEIFGISTIARDISERVKLEESQQALNHDLAQANEALRSSNDQLKQFAYITSHDLREPLRTISGFLQLLKDEYSDKLGATAKEYIDFAVNGSIRLQSMINSLLAFNKLDAFDQNTSVFSLDEAAKISIQELGVLISESNSDVTCVESGYRIFGNQDQITQVFQNLISNALKFRKKGEGARIEISYECRKGDDLPARLDPDKDYCVATVRDYGIGIESEYFERIFVIFQKLHPSSEYEGSGIGLSLCQKIVNLHGGAIWVDSQLDEGSSFKFAVPIYN